MKVAWIHGVRRGRPPSMNKYVESLHEAMEGAGASPGFEIVIDEIEGVRTPVLNGLINRFILYSLHVRSLPCERYHVHHPVNAHVTMLLPPESTKIITVYDLYGLGLRSYGREGHALSFLIKRGLERADFLVAISEHMKGEIAGSLSFPGERIRVIYSGLDHGLYRPIGEGGDVLKRYGIPAASHFVLFVGSEIRRKNFDGALRAFRRLAGAHPDLILAKVGTAGSARLRRRSLETVSSLGLGSRVRFCGFVPEEDLPHFYSSAKMLLAPSFLEGGSGMHVLEAMACGCPVVVSDLPQVAEMVGGSVLLCDPSDDGDIAEKAEAVVSDGALASRLGESGVAKASEYSWDRCAREHLDLYREVFGQPT